MGRAIIHRTPGLLDVQAITVMGLSAKPNSTSPIGQFGTGLKYAIATLIRLGATPRIFIGRDEYVFEKKAAKFRGQDLERITMRRRRFGLTGWHRTELPFTTNYGKFWQPWMAFRELEANTRDEGGKTFEASISCIPSSSSDGGDLLWRHTAHDEREQVPWCLPDHTTIIVESPEYVEAWEHRDEIFLPIAERTMLAERAGIIRVLEGESPHAYYRTLRALDLPKPSAVTWCLDAETGLTEDRFITEYWLRYWAGLLVVQSEDEALIERVLTAGEDYWEHGLTWPDHVAPSPAFRRVVARRPRGMSHGVYGYLSAHTPPDYSRRSAWDVHGRPWSVDEAGGTVVDVSGRAVMVRPEKISASDWRQMMGKALVRINRPPDELPQEPTISQRGAYARLIAEDPGVDIDTLWSALRQAGRTSPETEEMPF